MMTRKTGNTGRSASQAHSDHAIPPGEYLAKVMGVQGVSKTKLAAQLCLSNAEMDMLLAGNKPLTQALAERLEKAMSVPANIWLGLEAEYRAAQTKENLAEAPS
jgi:HTH-type transcriptional regulator / antitoxin HigA